MAFYYVKSGGTASGDAGRYGTQQTGSFASIGASGYYDNIRAAMDATTAPTSDDYILVSDAHSHNYTSNTQYDGPTSGNFCYILSVSDSNCDQASVGASESTSDAQDINGNGRLTWFGVTLLAGDDFYLLNFKTEFIFNQCDIGVNGSSDRFTLFGDGVIVKLINSTLRIQGTGAEILLARASTLEVFGGSVLTTADLFQGGFTDGGGVVRFIGVDLSQVSSYLIGSVGSDETNDDTIFALFEGCKLNASLTGYLQETLSGFGHKVLISNCSSDSDAAEYQYYYTAYGGSVEDQDDAGIHRDESVAYPSGTKASLKVVTNTGATTMSPFVMDFPTKQCNLSSASSDVITIYFASTATLTDNDVWAELVYPDGTTKQTYNYLSNANSDPLATGTTHTDDSSGSTWKNGASDLTGYNEYRMTLDTSGDAGADSVPILRVYVAKASTTVYFDTTIELG